MNKRLAKRINYNYGCNCPCPEDTMNKMYQKKNVDNCFIKYRNR